MTFCTKSAEETVALGKKIGALLSKGDVIAMRGTLAAGKTTITKGIAHALGIQEEITSPTFCLISEYNGKMPLYHFDAYRLDSAEDFINLGADDMLYGEGVCIIEWSEKVQEELPDTAIQLTICVNDNKTRTITIENWQHSAIDGACAAHGSAVTQTAACNGENLHYESHI
ncbi:MAG: tRNA (adenosine(37)-N6)-threonylcarbamoyltransferase complex ATPase subunit type 1 TsaE [Treponema sp.]|nr:tRNA (adenosine(37)-N6)-threonylcarbamoyltransferase complex ATPase subunit type 1 TsaE [Treponema sp.]